MKLSSLLELKKWLDGSLVSKIKKKMKLTMMSWFIGMIILVKSQSPIMHILSIHMIWREFFALMRWTFVILMKLYGHRIRRRVYRFHIEMDILQVEISCIVTLQEGLFGLKILHRKNKMIKFNATWIVINKVMHINKVFNYIESNDEFFNERGWYRLEKERLVSTILLTTDIDPSSTNTKEQYMRSLKILRIPASAWRWVVGQCPCTNCHCLGYLTT